MKIIEHRLESNDVFIVPFGDVQYGNPACSVKYVKRYLDWTRDMSMKLGCVRRFIGTGDYIDLMSPSNRGRYRASGLYSSTVRVIEDRTFIPVTQEALELLGPDMKGETVALCQGHHWMNLENGLESSDGSEHFHTDKWFAAELGAQFVHSAVIVKFVFPSGREYRILATHGEGNGQTLTYGINKMERQSSSWEAVDAFAMGHTHKAGFAASVRIREEEGELVSRQVPLLTCGGFLKSYLVDEVNYPEQLQMGALPLAATALRVTEVSDSNSGLLIQPMGLL